MPAFARTLNPFLRTARTALKQSNGVNPLQSALMQRQSGVQILNTARTYAAVFQRTKPHVNIGMKLRGYRATGPG